MTAGCSVRSGQKFGQSQFDEPGAHEVVPSSPRRRAPESAGVGDAQQPEGQCDTCRKEEREHDQALSETGPVMQGSVVGDDQCSHERERQRSQHTCQHPAGDGAPWGSTAHRCDSAMSAMELDAKKIMPATWCPPVGRPGRVLTQREDCGKRTRGPADEQRDWPDDPRAAGASPRCRPAKNMVRTPRTTKLTC